MFVGYVCVIADCLLCCLLRVSGQFRIGVGLFFWLFLAFGCYIIFGFGMREKTGAWAPDLVAGEEGKQAATNAAFSPCWGEQLWGPGGKGKFLVKKLHFFLHFLGNP